MTNKSLKIQIYILLFISFINLIYYFSPETFGDNVLVISSSDIKPGLISYYFSSFFSLINYYSGIWIFFPVTLIALFYFIFFSRRKMRFDQLAPSLILLYSLSFYHLFFPLYLGEGIIYFLDTFVSIYISFLVFLSSFFLLSYILFQNKFLKALIIFSNKLSLIGLKTIRYVSKKFNKAKNESPLKIEDSKTIEKPKPIIKEITPLEPVAPIPVVRTAEIVEVENKKTIPDKKQDIHYEYETSNLVNKLSDKIERVQVAGPDRDYYEQISKAIEDKLQEFNIPTKIVNVRKGPVVDTFELELGEGVKVSKVINLSDDISMALRGTLIRLVYPLKGKTSIGIEVPRSKREFIYLDEILNSQAFNSSNMRLPVAMGKDVFGDVSVVDLASMPHMLVAGSTGAGKSVFVNTLLVSLLVKKSPKEMKLLLIDPKQLELALYSNLPHLCLPVITEAKNATVALLWAVEEMERRYSILKNLGVRNIDDFNKKIKTCDIKQIEKIREFYSEEDEDNFELPFIVIIIDEFADLILTKFGKEIETSVNRLAAKARAAGIHLVLATQRPSTDIITGVIKANFPTRVAFRVSTAIDSRVVLDQMGAEKLLGKGDMLYKFGINLDRLHSAYIDEEEISGLVETLEALPGSYNEKALKFLETGDADNGEASVSYSGSGAKDELFDEACRIVIEQGSASASMLQRRLRVGYNRAANLVEEMERAGIVGPQEGSKPRKILTKSVE